MSINLFTWRDPLEKIQNESAEKRVWFSSFYIASRNKLHWLYSCSHTFLGHNG